jgi:DNA-binding transcriptional ArsR family regulator
MNTFSALADPTRRRIVEMLASHGRLSAGDISNRFSVSAPAISQHLKVLRESRLVQMEKKAQQRMYTINPAGISEMEQWARHMRQLWNERFDALEELLKVEMKKAARKSSKRSTRHVQTKPE